MNKTAISSKPSVLGPKIKICGLSRPQDIEAVNNYLPDYIGFVFAKSRRQVTADTAKELKEKLDNRIKAVGVFVNESTETIASLCHSNTIDIIQLHGDEEEAYIRHLKTLTATPIIKAVRVKKPLDVVKAREYTCDYLLFDTYTDTEYGGSGKTFDWSILTNIEKPYFLAGGIHAGNILTAGEQSSAYCIDVSSGVETDGYKDSDKIKEIIELIRSVN
jgi:phosphoribosylanthranilate isomerase